MTNMNVDSGLTVTVTDQDGGLITRKTQTHRRGRANYRPPFTQRIFWVPEIADLSAPTLAELNAGRPLADVLKAQ